MVWKTVRLDARSRIFHQPRSKQTDCRRWRIDRRFPIAAGLLGGQRHSRRFANRSAAQVCGRLSAYYNEQVFKWERRTDVEANVDDFVIYDDTKISWSGDLKLDLKRSRNADFAERKIRKSLYCPFTKSNLFFDRVMNNRVYGFPTIFPTPEKETENRVICVSGLGSNKPFHALMTEMIPCFDILEKTQCFPFYTYDEDGKNRRENITRWGLA